MLKYADFGYIIEWVIYMKKIIVLFIIFFSIHSHSNAEYVKFKDWKTGEMYNYEVYTFDEMFSAFEDLNMEYDNLMEEYGSLENNYSELALELNEKEEEIKYLEDKIDNQISLGTEAELYDFVELILLILGIYLIVYVFKALFKKLKERK